MKMRIQLIIENESGLTTTAEIAAIERGEADDLVGISLEEAKTLTGGVQRALVESQAHEAIHPASDEEAHHHFSSKPGLNQFGLPTRNPLRAVGIDGGYVKASVAPSR